MFFDVDPHIHTRIQTCMRFVRLATRWSTDCFLLVQFNPIAITGWLEIHCYNISITFCPFVFQTYLMHRTHIFEKIQSRWDFQLTPTANPLQANLY